MSPPLRFLDYDPELRSRLRTRPSLTISPSLGNLVETFQRDNPTVKIVNLFNMSEFDCFSSLSRESRLLDAAFRSLRVCDSIFRRMASYSTR